MDASDAASEGNDFATIVDTGMTPMWDRMAGAPRLSKWCGPPTPARVMQLLFGGCHRARARARATLPACTRNNTRAQFCVISA